MDVTKTQLFRVRSLIVIVILLFSSLINYSQDCKRPDLIPYRKGKKWGYCDSTRKILIPVKYDGAETFDYLGRAMVFMGGKRIIINHQNAVVKPNPIGDDELQSVRLNLDNADRIIKAVSGKFGLMRHNRMLVDTIYNRIELPRVENNEIAIVRHEKTGWGLYNLINNQVFPASEFDSLAFVKIYGAYKNTPDVALTYLGNKIGWWIISRNVVVKPQFEQVYWLNKYNGFFAVAKNNKWALATYEGILITDFKYSKIERQESDDTFLFFANPEKGLGYYIDCKGTEYFEN